ncbi:MAG: dTDP-glucose 4,6-dehydratase [Bacillota bacterium]|nr:dTDP-glucose 4,6-dehydratase [Bacillota bacterium]
MNVLVTGGAGFIGSHFLRHMVPKYPLYQFINLDALTYAGDPRNLEDLERFSNYRFIYGDICDHQLVNTVVSEGIHVIVNFAAESHVDRSIANARTFLDTNIGGTFTLLEAARQFGLEKFIQISTDEVYGSLGREGAFTEDSPLRPNNPYAASKTSADLLALAYGKTYRIPVTITRSSNNFGPFQHPEKLIPKMILNALADKPLPVYGDGQYVRDWIYVTDHCLAIELVLHSGKAGHIYNIGANQEYKNIDLVRNILNILQKPLSLIQFVADRPGHDRRYAINAAKIQRELGWQPVSNFQESLAATIRWFQQNSGRWEVTCER